MPQDDIQTTTLGRESKFKGELTCEGPVRVLGAIEGRITGQGEILIAEGSNCKASIDGRIVTIDGAVEGDVIARERLQLNNKARVRGDITAAALTVAEGAAFIGQVRVGPAAADAGVELEPKPNRPERPRQPAPPTIPAATNGTATPPWMQTTKPVSATTG